MSGSNRNTTITTNDQSSPITTKVKRLDDLAFKALLRARQQFIFETTPTSYCVIEKFQSKLDSENLSKALNLAADGSEVEIALPEGTKTNAIQLLLKMLEESPRLLLLKGNAKTAGGVLVNDVTIYEFCLGAGDPDLAKLIEPYFATIKDEEDPSLIKLTQSYFEKITGKKADEIDGESERQRQYARYKPYVDALAKQVESKTPTYDLKPLFEIIKNSSAADITEALNISDHNQTMTRNTPLRKAFAKFRNAVKPKKSMTIGMHYEHYTTLQQALDLLDSEWKTLSNDYNDYDKCRLVWRQIIGWLQRGLPRIDRFKFARAFQDNERTPACLWDNDSFPDIPDDDSSVTLGFAASIFGERSVLTAVWGAARAVGRGMRGWKSHVEQKLQACRTYTATSNPETARMHDCLKK
jgi:hypothetical protein